ncbi:helix-turn-helix domain-containing protein [Micromonospora sp. KC721]|uniref:AlbA family DNA-binding domain-containing protein n=1 Tax=Micromonospora sp. KC721 TaxID=2530380 RepID=UPI001052AE27|nr:ATP-binding protein [Micromonospora sp. KC721]TDB79610.1 ATP-binding protein [Micromonospora sp. KC721]
MPTLRNRRLEQLLGGPIDESLTYTQVTGLIPGTAEGPDLDFKRDTYGSRDRDRKALCGDVGGLANANGGLLILGMEEDSQGRAAKAVGVDISDAERLRLHQTVVANVQPTPTFDIIPVEDPDRPGTGFLVVWVARTATAPHAYIQNNALLYPKRIGTQTVWLSEALVAEAYRARFAGLADRIDEAARIERDFTSRLDSRQSWLVATLVPDLPGDFRIDTATLNAFEQDVAGRTISGLDIPLTHFRRAGVRHRRLVGSADCDANRLYLDLSCELHEDGSGSIAACFDARHTRPGHDDGPPPGSRIDDEDLVATIAAALKFLAAHARDRAAAGGLATLRVTIFPVALNLPAYLVHSRGHGFVNALGTHPVWQPPVADAVADIDELATDGRGLLAVTYRLATGLVQEFGCPEALQLTADGNVRRCYWHQQAQTIVMRYAERHGVDVIEDRAG